MEIDRSIALFVRQQRELGQEEQDREEREKYDPKKQITYTLEELAAGVKRGKQYLYTLKLCFTPRWVFGGKFCIPFITDFFDVMEERPQNLLYASNRRKAAMLYTYVTCGRPEAFAQWRDQVKDSMQKMGMQVKVKKSAAKGRVEYFCYETPTAEGVTYNILFRCPKDGAVYTGSLNCTQEDKEGMGLLLEAMVHVTEEMNR